jgi:hypothetical protein
MKQNRLLFAGVLAGLAWYLYTRERGLSVLGQPQYAAAPPRLPAAQSLTNPNASTSTFATNVFSSISNAFRVFTSSLQSAPGNGPRTVSASPTGIGPADVQSWGLAVPRDEPAPSAGAQVLTVDDGSSGGLAPFWSWGFGYSSPVPSMPWTLNPATLGFDPSYIPPPPG